MNRRVRVVLLAGVSLPVAPAAAFAHCVTTPDLIRPIFRDAAPDEIELYMNFGSALSTDGGKTWKLQCEEVYQSPMTPVGPNEIQVTPSGKIVVAYFRGMLSTADRGCTYQHTAGLPQAPDPDGGAPTDRGVLNARLDPADPENNIWMVVGDAQWGSELWKSTDGGKTASSVKRFGDQQLLRIMTDPADPKVLYLLSFRSVGPAAPRYLSYTFDGGATWQTQPSPWGEDEVAMLFVSPSNPRKLTVRHNLGNETLHELQIDDVGMKIGDTQIFEATNPAIPEDSRRLFPAQGVAPGELWVGVQGDDTVPDNAELHHSLDGGKTWTKVAGLQPHFRCLEFHGGMLWGCGNNLASGASDAFALGASADGTAWTKKFAFGELCEALSCITTVCRYTLMNVCAPGICGTSGGAEPAGAEAPGDGEVDGPRDAGQAPGDGGQKDGAADAGSSGNKKSGCRTMGGDGRAAAWAAPLLLLALLARARRRRR